MSIYRYQAVRYFNDHVEEVKYFYDLDSAEEYENKHKSEALVRVELYRMKLERI